MHVSSPALPCQLSIVHAMKILKRCYPAVFEYSNQVANPTFGYTGGAMVVLNQCVVSQGDTGAQDDPMLVLDF